MAEISAIAYAAIIVAVIGFQAALILGAPWGAVTQGGFHKDALPVLGRVAAGGSIVVLVAMGLAILSQAGIWPHWPRWAGWTAVGVQSLSTLANWATPSKPERRLWGPITSVLLALALVVMSFG